MSEQKSNIDLYTTQTPNGIKISITLEELGLDINRANYMRGSLHLKSTLQRSQD